MALGDERILEIVLRARDEASAVLKKAGQGVDGLTNLIKDNYKEAGLAATGLIASLGALTKSAVENAASYEQNRIAFESMLGSADKARTLLKQVSDFASKTPFELPQVVEGSKRLLAYNISAEKIIPTFKMLGDIAAGVGTDKLPQLITAFGQVQAKGKLMGQELLQFTEAGVGLGQALQKQFGVSRGVLEDMISTGKVGFADVEKALTSMTSKGGLFFEGMERQSHSFNGIVSNIRDNFGKFIRDVVGISETGDIRKGSLFEALKNGAERFLVTLDRVRPQITAMANAFSQNQTAIMAVVGAIGGLLVLAIGAAVVAFAPAIAVMLAFAAAGATIVGTITYLNTTFDLFKTKQDLVTDAQQRAKSAVDAHWQAVKNLDDAIKGLNNAELSLEGAQLSYERAQRNLAEVTRNYGADTLEAKEARHQLKVAEEGVRDAMDQVHQRMDEAQKKHDEAVKQADAVVKAQDQVKDAVNRQASAWDNVRNGIKGVLGEFSNWTATVSKAGGGAAGILGGLKLSGFAEGTNFAPGGLALVGERGPELVNLPRGSQVVPNNRTEQILNNQKSIVMNNHFHTDISADTLIRQLSFAFKFDSAIL